MIEIQIKYETKSLLSRKNFLKEVASKFLSKKGIRNAELSILISTDERIKTLNKKYRDINKPTDVLSFSQVEVDCPNSKLLGDIVISTDTLKKHAKIYGNSIDDELKLLVIHGINHLLGVNHK